ncbi:hypothetical protein EDEG_00792 [Edhazardia aedis USNM 41457]|uniref:Uncharacterized protein n=1 Tax=Edhazardia aedis (strain USNM 41457) TaxID=1003232 RepID=J9DV19_EDHAE|nr:hypothetical protein EDEG_00792 [Edhazardia aedis USNM 41457]|eukprot:EJW05122.1 hypothetical protein EDEG_00792 [Edhazardia aedis USNM 41457]
MPFTYYKDNFKLHDRSSRQDKSQEEDFVLCNVNNSGPGKNISIFIHYFLITRGSWCHGRVLFKFLKFFLFFDNLSVYDYFNKKLNKCADFITFIFFQCFICQIH